MMDKFTVVYVKFLLDFCVPEIVEIGLFLTELFKMWNNSVLVGLQCTEMTVLPVTVIMVIDIDEMISSSCLLCVAELFGRSSDNTTSQDVVHHSETV